MRRLGNGAPGHPGRTPGTPSVPRILNCVAFVWKGRYGAVKKISTSAQHLWIIAFENEKLSVLGIDCRSVRRFEDKPANGSYIICLVDTNCKESKIHHHFLDHKINRSNTKRRHRKAVLGGPSFFIDAVINIETFGI